jgi:RNA polymerase subunit RPABC4/transcription elongation factor Spt4
MSSKTDIDRKLARGQLVRCRKCRALNDADAGLCHACGATIRQACRACGKVCREPGASFCPHCGKRLHGWRG